MSLQAFVSINFVAETADEVQAFVDGLKLPEGANVNASTTKTLTTGIVQDGSIVDHVEATAEPVPSPVPEEPAP